LPGIISGLVPLYVGWDQHGNFFVASELKALEGSVKESRNFFTGALSLQQDGIMTRWYTVGTGWNMKCCKNNKTPADELRSFLEDDSPPLMSDVPYAFLSGGLDFILNLCCCKEICLQKRMRLMIR